jgi:predicted acetyltransferase
MEIEIRPFAGDVADYGRVTGLAFNGNPERDPEDNELFAALFEAERALGAYERDQAVGVAGIETMQLSVPGGQLPAAGVTAVAVMPTHRRRGILTALMRRQLRDVHEREEPIAALWASEGAIYQRFGYGLGTFFTGIEVERRWVTFRPGDLPLGLVRLATPDEARRIIPEIHDRVAPTRPGFFSRSPAFWEAEVFFDPPRYRGGGGPMLFAIHETDGRPDGYLRYRMTPEWVLRGPNGTLSAMELVGENPAATRALWEYAFGVDLVVTVRARPLPADTPLLWMVTEPRRLGATLGDGLWLRVIDVAAALEARSYAAEANIVLQLHDRLCDWNDGRWALELTPDGARVAPTDREPQLVLEAADLAAIYLGGTSVGQLLAAGRGEERAPGAAGRLDAALRTSVAPWCPVIF